MEEEKLKMKTVKLTAAQALVKWMIAQKIEQFDGSFEMAFKGVWLSLIHI
mgnify:CR=1 FL=1